MNEESTHPLLAQVALTVSPFVSLPSATTLPYTYKSLPSSIPLSSIADQSRSSNADPARPKYVVSASGHAAHPEDIAASCQALKSHLIKLRSDAKSNLEVWEDGLKERELAEKRRVAPGWLDRNEKILQPEKVSSGSQQTEDLLADSSAQRAEQLEVPRQVANDEGEELDRAFGGMNIRPR